MKLTSIVSSILALSAALLSQVQANTYAPYVGMALAWDHMGGKRSEHLKNNAQHIITYSNDKSLAANRVNAYFFAGVTYIFKNSPLFIAPEFQIGHSTLKSSLNKNVPDNDYPINGVAGNPIQRNINPKLSRKLNTSLVTKVGANIAQSYSLYGLVGVDASQFKYNYRYQNLDFNTHTFSGSQTFKKTKWKLAPVFGIGVGKKMDKLGISLEYRFAPYGTIKTSKTIATRLANGAIDAESISGKVKPFISTVMVRVSYFF